MGAVRYTPLVKIAAGGMATVFAGLDQDGALVALKRPHEHLIDDQRFLRSLRIEAELGRSLTHPNVVGIQQVVMEHDTLYLVMAYVDGVTLSELVRACAGRIPVRVAVRILLDATAGLAFAHDLKDDAGRRLGIVHRDVSPANILVGADGVSRVSDFGIAKAMEQADASTSTGIKGKAAYMAPEYIRGKGLDQRSDVFALGVIAWELLTGERLFRTANDAETIDRVLNLQAPPLRSVDPALQPFDEVLAHALTKDPDERFLHAAAFAGAFQTVAASSDFIATTDEVRAFVEDVAGAQLAKRREAIEAARKVASRTTVTDAVRKRPPTDPTKTVPNLEPPVFPDEPAEEATLASEDLAVEPLPPPPSPRRFRIAGVALLVAAGLAAVTAPLLFRSSTPAASSVSPSAPPTIVPAGTPSIAATQASPATSAEPIVTAPPAPTRSAAPARADAGTRIAHVPSLQTVIAAPADAGWRPAPASDIYGH